MHPVLRLYEDVLSSAENVVFRLPPLPRFIFVAHGSATAGGTVINGAKPGRAKTPSPLSRARTASPAGAGSLRAATRAAPPPTRPA